MNNIESKFMEMTGSTDSGAVINEGTIVEYKNEHWLIVEYVCPCGDGTALIMQPHKGNAKRRVSIMKLRYIKHMTGCNAWLGDKGYIVTPKGYVISLTSHKLIVCPKIREKIGKSSSWHKHLLN